MYGYNEVPFSEMVGKTITSIKGAVGDEEIVFQMADGGRYVQWYEQD